MNEADQWHRRDAGDAARAQGVDPALGLGEADLARRALEYGANELTRQPRRSPVRLLLEQFTDFMVLVLLGAALISGLIGDLVDTLTILFIVAVNALIALVDLYHLGRLTLRRETFTLVRVPAGDAAFLKPFLSMYKHDIARFFPDFELASIPNPRCVFILRDLAPVGLFIYADEGSGAARIHLDYVVPAYRDLKAARFFYNRSWRLFLDEGFHELIVRNPVPAHERFCRKVGFGPSLTNPRALVRTLAAGADLPAASRSQSKN